MGVGELLVLLILVGVVAGVGLAVARLRTRRVVAHPACGQCGYNVRGLSTFFCPECGADLRDVGIVTPDPASTRSGPGWALAGLLLVGWSFICLLLLLVIAIILPRLHMAASGTGGTATPAARVTVMLPCMLWAVLAIGGVWAILRWARRAPARAMPRPTPPPLLRASTQPVGTITRMLAVMFIDMQGYPQRTAAASREEVVDLVRRTRELVQPIIQKHRGVIVKTMGDAFLVYFDSPTEAVLTGREIQAATTRRNQAAAPAGQLALRIGISTGEVALEREDLYGEPVNLASRLQQLAGPGEVYFSESTCHVMARGEVAHEAVGDVELKGVPGKVKVYRVTNAASTGHPHL